VADEIFGLLPCILCGFGDDDYQARLTFGRRRRDSESCVNFVVNSMCADRGGGSSQTKNLLDRHAQTSLGQPNRVRFSSFNFPLCVRDVLKPRVGRPRSRVSKKRLSNGCDLFRALNPWLTVPGSKHRLAWTLVAEVGPTLAAFPSAADLVSWAGVCPGHNKTAGKGKSGTTHGGNPWLRRALCEAAWAASKSKGTYLQAQFRRLAALRGPERALIAVANSILTGSIPPETGLFIPSDYNNDEALSYLRQHRDLCFPIAELLLVSASIFGIMFRS
jgi:hypothetical protein